MTSIRKYLCWPPYRIYNPYSPYYKFRRIKYQSMIVNNQRSQFKMTPMCNSSTQFQRTGNQKPTYNPFTQISKTPSAFQNEANNRPDIAHPIQYSRPITSQSMILTSSKVEKKSNFSKLDGMARKATQIQEEVPANNIPKLQIHKLYENISINQNLMVPQHKIQSHRAYLSPNVGSQSQQKWPYLQPPNQRQPIGLGLAGCIDKQKQASTYRTNDSRQSSQLEIQKKQENQKSPQSTHSSKSAQTDCLNTQKNKFQFFKNRKQIIKNQKKEHFLTVPNCNQSMQQLQQFNATHPHLKAPEFLSVKSNQLPTHDGVFLDTKQLKINVPNKSYPPAEAVKPLNIEFKKKIVRQNQGEPTKISPKLQFTLMKRSMNSSQIITAKDRRNVRPQRQIKITDFQLLDKLGKGAFGDVYMAQQKTIGLMCVIKKMSKQRIKDRKVEEHILREIKIQSYLNHSNLTALYGCFHDEENIYLILEALPDGSLQQVKKKKKLPEKQTAAIIKQVSEGLKYMHEEYIIHRDLKPQNLFVNEKLIKIGDFGCSIYNRDLALRKTVVGCLEYSSPEQLSQQGYSEKIDSWSLGILTYELLYGKSPFESDMIKLSINKDHKAGLSELSFPESVLIEKKTRDFIENLLSENPNLRMDMDAVLRHPFLCEDF